MCNTGCGTYEHPNRAVPGAAAIMIAAGRKKRGSLVAASIAVFTAAVLLCTGVFVYLTLHVTTDSPTLEQVVLRDARLPCTVTVYGRSQDTLSARISFYTARGNLVKIMERSWSGWELIIDCIVVGESGGWLVFPFRVYTDETSVSKGLDLFRFYADDGFPVLYETGSLQPEEKKRLQNIFSIVKTEAWMPGFFGTLRHETVSIRTFEAGREYALYVNERGKLSLVAN